MEFNFRDILSISLILFAVIDILGSIPVILDIKSKVGYVNARQATLVSGGIMILFLFVGKALLKLIGIDLASFSIAGAIVIFLIGLEMILNRDIFKSGNNPATSTIVPIAFPIIAGAGTLTTLLSLRSEYALENILVGVFINLVIVYVVLHFIPRIERILGEAGISILRRVFGIILLSIAIKLMSNNIGNLISVPAS
jgi:multiple antibiotic resistance protein